jgi:hypothetical protein
MTNGASRFKAANARHSRIDQGDIRTMPFRFGDGVGPIYCFVHNVDSNFMEKQGLNTLPK